MSEELTLLKERATAMGIAYSPNIGLGTLKAKIEAALNDTPAPPAEEGLTPAPETTVVSSQLNTAANDALRHDVSLAVSEKRVSGSVLSPAQQKMQLRKEQTKEQMRLVRIRVTCLNPVKKDLRGEIITVANAILGTVRKFVPFGEATDAGYHVPFIIYNELKSRRFQSVKTRRGPKNEIVLENRLVPEFALEVLEPLTPKELEQLARQQAAAAGVE
jgi:hypothetical protein